MKRALLLVWMAIACQSPSSPPEPRPAAPSARAAAPSELEAPWQALARLDTRKPVPLLPMMAQHQKQNMRDHLLVVQQVVAAAASRDFAQVAQVARGMGYSDAMGKMCQHMGAGAPGFTEQALAMHHAADRIAAAATTQDTDAVLSALAETLATCTTCHASYKQQLVSTLPE